MKKQIESPKIEKLINLLEPLYLERSKDLLFHGWHHITFVKKKALKFAETINADKLIVEAAALTHDLNYLVQSNSKPEKGKSLRQELLNKAGFTLEEITKIETTIMESHTGTRNEKVTPESMALSDADTLFKVLPITTVIFSQRYITQNKVDIHKLADKITSEQNPLIEQKIYFYTAYARRRYLSWAKNNLALWNDMLKALEDEDVQEILKIADDF
jgi:uncharacterized protein